MKYLAPFIALCSGMVMAEDTTYVDDVAPIINNNCVVCHREGGIGPMSFESYEQIRPWSPLISYKVANREMPPYAYDEHIGIQNLEGDWRLRQDEIDSTVKVGQTVVVPTMGS